MQLYNNVYMATIKENIHGLVEVHHSNEIHFVLSDDFYKEIKDKKIDLTTYVNDYMEKRFNIPDSYYKSGCFPWMSEQIEIRTQFPAIAKNLVSNFDELHLHIKYILQQYSDFYADKWTDAELIQTPRDYARLVENAELITEKDL